MEAILAAYQNITARQYVRNVDRLHRRWKRGNQTAKKNTRRAAQKYNNWRQKYRFEVNHHDHRKKRKKTRKCKENGKHAAMLETPERAYEDCQDKLKKACLLYTSPSPRD